ncbi:MAG: sugar phosphate nucleotidyltransferase [bacterium]|jgi:mannose-1-phosphate guanylyltransferase|nr:sugar phosphate nucleotidyltransferase [bacterium]
MNTPILSVIMAGGSGERFWPISRRQRPKQLLKLTSETEMMLEESVNRLLPLLPKDHIFIATSTTLAEPTHQAMPSFPKENIVGEPCKRNTAGCLVNAVAHILARFGEEAMDYLMSVTTADHLIGDTDRFCDTVTAALQYAEQDEALVTIGVHPTRPETGYGYIEINQLNKPIWDYQGIPVYNVARFLEKPGHEDAERYQASRFYYWNSGMFFWRIRSLMVGLEKYAPQHAACILRMADLLRDNPKNPAIQAEFEQLPDISIDYALMEKADNVYVALGDFRWDDVGSWDSLSRFRQRDEQRNTPIGNPVLIDCRNVTVYNEPGMDQMAVCVIGMEDLIVVTSQDSVLVCPKNRAQDVKRAVQELIQRNAKQI